MTDIDYEALAKAGYDGSARSQSWIGIARAVVAAYEAQLRDRGFMVLRSEDVAALRSATDIVIRRSTDDGLPRPVLRMAWQRSGAALAALGDGG